MVHNGLFHCTINCYIIIFCLKCSILALVSLRPPSQVAFISQLIAQKWWLAVQLLILCLRNVKLAVGKHYVFDLHGHVN